MNSTKPHDGWRTRRRHQPDPKHSWRSGMSRLPGPAPANWGHRAGDTGDFVRLNSKPLPPVTELPPGSRLLPSTSQGEATQRGEDQSSVLNNAESKQTQFLRA
ncbi:unnamed protein product [Rangifer tarandus platyrhynchus]|uniref:Uncharacterized protein n=1 Tax=Rangifer tarandus platyrhynchus TaxID=3082113 RepID=A0AC59YD46_RANTA